MSIFPVDALTNLHYHILFILYFICIATQSTTISKYIDCIDVAGDDPSGTFLVQSTASCPITYSITSCGAKAMGNSAYSEGTYIQTNGIYECVAPSPFDYFGFAPEKGIRAYARCCNITDYGSSFKYLFSSLSPGGNDAISTITCPINEKLIGCGGAVQPDHDRDDYWMFDGSYAEDTKHIGNTSKPFYISSNKCTTQNGPNGYNVWTEAVCYDTSTINDGYIMDCVSVWGHKSNMDGSHSSTVSCPAGGSFNYFMTSCTAYSPSAAIQSYYIENNVCTAIDTGGSNYVIANAICCNMSMGPPDIATTDPTADPTSYPSNPPTFKQTYIPSISLTKKDSPILIAGESSKPITTAFSGTMKPTPSPQIDGNFTSTETLSNTYELLSYLAIFLCCCICVIIATCKCIKRRRKRENYFIDTRRKRAASQSIITDAVGNKKQNVIIEMSPISSASDAVSIKDNVNNEQFGDTPGSGAGDMVNDEFVVEDDNNDNMEIITPGTIDINGREVLMDNDAMNDRMSGDIVILENDENETPETSGNDKQIGDIEEKNIVTIGLDDDNGKNENDNIISSGNFKEEIVMEDMDETIQ